MEGAPAHDRIRVAELVAALSLATDLGLGRPLEHELGVCLAALDLADRLSCGPEERAAVYYVGLLAHVGCTAAASELAALGGGDDIAFQRTVQALGPVSEPTEDVPHLVRHLGEDRPLGGRVRLVARALATGSRATASIAAEVCDGARLLAEQLYLPKEVGRALSQFTERWDGRGHPRGTAGEEIPRALRIVRVAHDLVAVAHARDLAAAVAALQRRRGRGHDPAAVDAALADPVAILRAADAPDAWERVVDAEPPPVATVSRAGLSTVARAFGEFTDVKVGFLRGHSGRVAQLAGGAAEALGCAPGDVADVRAAGHFHDVGRVAVSNGIWEKPASLTAGEQERVRLHPYLTERVLGRSPPLESLAPLAGAHHERLDGSGYHRGATAPQLGTGARILAAADAYDAMTHVRPHRPALSRDEARRQLTAMVGARLLDGRAVDAVLEAAGAPPLGRADPNPAGLSDRELEVLRLVAQGATNRQIAEALVITEKTAGHHVEHIYAKTGVSTRVGAALFAMRHDLVA